MTEHAAKKGSTKKGKSRSPKKASSHYSGALLIIMIVLLFAEGAVIAYYYNRFRVQELVSVSLTNELGTVKELLQEQRDATMREAALAADLEKKLAEIKETKETLASTVKEQQNVVAQLEERVSRINEDKVQKEAALERQKKIAAYLRTRLKGSKEIELNLMRRLEELLSQKNKLEDTLAKLEGGGNPAESSVDAIELSETVVTGTPVPAPARERGQILIANNKYGFIILNRGSGDGVAIGDEVAIQRQEETIGWGRVKKLYETMSLADVIDTASGARVEKGLTVSIVPPREE